MKVERSVKEKGELGDSGGRSSYYVFREADFSTRTGRKRGKMKTSQQSSRWREKPSIRNDESVTEREGRGRRRGGLARDGLTCWGGSKCPRGQVYIGGVFYCSRSQTHSYKST